MFSMVRTPHPPTGVEHSIYANFFGHGQKNLIVAGANILRVFRLVPDESDAATVVSEGLQRPPKMRLECQASFTLNGTIAGLEKVTLPSSVRDTLVLSFPEAKLSVVEYDPETHDLKTLSLHIFEVKHMLSRADPLYIFRAYKLFLLGLFMAVRRRT
jgi:cleavage and polyadenylation specificity factor subunit 1